MIYKIFVLTIAALAGTALGAEKNHSYPFVDNKMAQCNGDHEFCCEVECFAIIPFDFAYCVAQLSNGCAS